MHKKLTRLRLFIRSFTTFRSINPTGENKMKKSFVVCLLILFSAGQVCIAQSGQASKIFSADTAHASPYNLYGA